MEEKIRNRSVRFELRCVAMKELQTRRQITKIKCYVAVALSADLN
jgi:hypothetical protein